MKFFILISVTLIACSSSNEPSHPKAGEAVTEFMNAYCGKLQGCFPDQFAVLFPNGTSDCVQRALNGLANKDAMESCTQAQIDTCTKDTNGLACTPTADTFKLPQSCDGC